MNSWPKGIAAITLFVEHLEAGKHFYGEVFGLPAVFEDDDLAVFRFGDTLVNLLKTTAAAELIEPAMVASPGAGSASCSPSRSTTSLPNHVRLKLELLDERRFGNGVVHLFYPPGRAETATLPGRQDVAPKVRTATRDEMRPHTPE